MRIRRKDLRRPDEFVTITTRAAQYVQRHARLFGWSGGVLAATLIATVGVANFRAVRRQQASADLAQALKPFATGDYDQATPLLEDFRSKWKRSSLRPLADLYLGEAALQRGNHDQAALALEEAAAQLPARYLRQQALVSLAYALEANGDFAAAAQRFEHAAEIRGPYQATALLGAARNRERASDSPKAQETYRRFLTRFPAAPEAHRIRALLTARPEG